MLITKLTNTVISDPNLVSVNNFWEKKCRDASYFVFVNYKEK